MTPPDAGEAVVIRKRIAATRDEVFKAWTDADGMRSWMCPGDTLSAVVELDLRVGGALRIVMQSATESFEHRGEFVAVQPPAKLAFTWSAKATGFRPTLVTVDFIEAEDGHCDLVLTHERLPRPDVKDQYRGGWDQIVTRLARFLQDQR